MAILAILCVIAVGLGTANIFVLNNNRNNQGDDPNNSQNNNQSDDTSQGDTQSLDGRKFQEGEVVQTIQMPDFENMSEEEIKAALYHDGMNEAQIEDARGTEEFYKIKKEIKQMLEAGNVDTNAINQKYRSAVEEWMQKKNETRVSMYILDWLDTLSSKGYGKEAINEIVKIDFSSLGDTNRQKVYTLIANTAGKLGESEIQQRYNNLANEAQEAFERKRAEAQAKENK